MRRYILALIFLLATSAVMVFCQKKYEVDTLRSREGDIEISFLGHGSLMFKFDGKIIYVDPVGQFADFSQMPKADFVLVTHEHSDHLDSLAIEKCRTEKTTIICTEAGVSKVRDATVLKNGDRTRKDNVTIEAVPAYNLVHMRSPGVPFHAKGAGNGYVLTLGGRRIYVAGDTENIPEMSNLGIIECAFLPMNLPYTMTPEMVAEAAKRIHPKILYPYHFGKTDTTLLLNLLKDQQGMEIRIRKMQ